MTGPLFKLKNSISQGDSIFIGMIFIIVGVLLSIFSAEINRAPTVRHRNYSQRSQTGRPGVESKTKRMATFVERVNFFIIFYFNF